MNDAKKTKRQLIEELVALRQLVENLNIGIVHTDPGGKILYHNPYARTMMGYEKKDYANLRTEDIYVRLEDREELVKSLETKGEHTYEYQLRRKDGQSIWVRGVTRAVRDRQGNIAHYQGFVEDITRQKKEEARQTALRRVRDEVWRMQGEDDIEKVLKAVRDELFVLEIPFRYCAFNIIETGPPEPTVRRRSIASRIGSIGDWRIVSLDRDGPIAQSWFTSQVYYRPDLQAEDLYQERANIEAVCSSPVRAVIDIPFSHGTLALNSDRPSPFSKQDLALLQGFADILSEGYRRLGDLQRLERRNQELAQSQQRHELATQAGQVGVWDWNVDTGEIFVDPNLKAMLGYRNNEIRNHLDDWGGRIHPDDAPQVMEAAEAHLRGETPVYEIAHRMVHKDGSVRWFLARGTAFRDADGQAYRVVGTDTDITEQRRVEEERKALQRLSQRLTESLSLQQIGRIVADESRQLFDHHAFILAMCDVARQGMVALLCEDTPAGADRPREYFIEPRLQQNSAISRILAGEHLLVERAEKMDYIQLNPMGETSRKSCSLMFVPIVWEEECIGMLSVQSYTPDRYGERDLELLQIFATQCGGAIRNAQLFAEVSESRRRLQSLSRRLVEVQEEERRGLAKELHDEVGQMLTGLNYFLETSKKLSAAQIKDRLNEAQEQVGELLVQVRELSLDLRPSMLDDLGLIPALQWHCNRFWGQTGIQVDFSAAEGIGRLPADVEVVAYRIVQEGLTNVARHAGAEEAGVKLWRKSNGLHLVIEDQGCGFDPEEKLAARDTSGLSGMKVRVELIDGTFFLESAPNRGTRVQIHLPVGQQTG